MAKIKIRTVEITNINGSRATAEKAATKLASILTGTFLDLRGVAACPDSGSFTINVTGTGSEREITEMAMSLLASAAIKD